LPCAIEDGTSPASYAPDSGLKGGEKALLLSMSMR
jgi:hypothetical protein